MTQQTAMEYQQNIYQENTNTVHFFIRRQHTNAPCGVVAMRAEGGGKVRVAISLCAAVDSWNKKAGVAKAYGRLVGQKNYLFDSKSQLTFSDIISKLVKRPSAIHSLSRTDFEHASDLFEKQIKWFEKEGFLT